ncbi:acetyltransferase [Moorena producens]|uniref:acetyltransferase n=1 Tax=Moorena producens TaxID=1155739 RepID=UPI003C73FDB5
MSRGVIGLGAGGHAKVVIEILQRYSQYKLVGLLDSNPELKGKSLLGVPILGDDEQLPLIKAQGVEYFFVGLGSTSNLVPRRRLYELACSFGMKPVTAVHPSAMISPSVLLGEGATVMAGAIINAEVRVGENVIVNSGAIVEHDCVIGHHVHIATSARLGGAVYVRDNTHIGIGAVIRQLIQVGKGSVIGAGAVVVKDVPDGQILIGNPARLLRRSQ